MINKVTSTITAVLISTVLLNSMYVHAMFDHDTHMSDSNYGPGDYNDYLQRNCKTKIQKAEKYNQYNPLIALCDDIFKQILSYCHEHDVPSNASTIASSFAKATNEEVLSKRDNAIKALEKSIKTFMQLSATCKLTHTLLTHEKIGTFCKNYPHEIKLYLFQNLMQPTSTPGDEIKHFPAVIILCAGIDTASIEEELTCLLAQAVESNDAQRVTTLFKHHADPNVQDRLYDRVVPIFFRIKTVEVAQEFIKKNVNLHVITHWPQTNVLWEVTKTHYPSELMKLYLAHHVDAKELHPLNNSCLFHKLTWSSLHIDDNFFKKAQLLLEAIPAMINTLNKKGETPLDLAYNALAAYHKKNINSKTLEAVIALFKHYGSKTAQELKKEGDISATDTQTNTTRVRTAEQKK